MKVNKLPSLCLPYPNGSLESLMLTQSTWIVSKRASPSRIICVLASTVRWYTWLRACKSSHCLRRGPKAAQSKREGWKFTLAKSPTIRWYSELGRLTTQLWALGWVFWHIHSPVKRLLLRDGTPVSGWTVAYWAQTTIPYLYLVASIDLLSRAALRTWSFFCLPGLRKVDTDCCSCGRHGT